MTDILSASAVAPYKAQDDYLITLQNLLATESAEKEATQAELYRWKKVVDGHRRQLIALVQDGMDRRGENVWRKLQDEMKGFGTNVQKLQQGNFGGSREDGLGGGGGPNSPRRTYDVLKASLNETQKRCESLNADMISQQEANAQLVASLNTAKENNKEILQQIQSQTQEITRLTQERISDEQKVEALTKRHKSEEELWKQDSYRRLQVLRDQGDERYNTTFNHLVSKLKFVEARAGVLKEEFEAIKMQCLEQRERVLELRQNIAQSFQVCEKSVLGEMERKERDHQIAREKLKDKIKELELKLVEEHEYHGHEVSSWSHRYVSVQAEKEDLQARMDREVSRLTSQKEGLDRASKSEAALFESEIAKLRTTLSDATKCRVDLEAQLDESKKEVFRLQSVYSAIETETQCKESVTQDLRKQLREADDALSAAVAGNEHLRCQMQEQQLRFTDMNECELTRLKTSFEEKLSKLKDQQQNESQLLEFQIKSLEEVLSEKSQQHERLTKMAEQLMSEVGVLERDVSTWKATFEQTVRNRQEMEREYAQCRQEWARQKLTVIETTETNDSKRATLEAELKYLTDSFIDYKRSASSRETELASRINAYEDVLKTTKTHTAEVMASLQDVVDTIGKTKSVSGMQLQSSAETCSQLERELDQRRTEWEEERRRLEICLENERRDAADSREKYERWREHHSQALKQVSDENQSKITQLETEKQKKEEAFKSEEQKLQLGLQANSAKIEHLKSEAARYRAAVQASNSQFTSLRHEVEREERECNYQHSQFYEELKSLAASVEESKRNEQTLTKHLESSQMRAELENKRLSKELEDTRGIGSNTLTEAESKLNQFRHTYSKTLEDASNKYGDELHKDRKKMETIYRENEQLKTFLGDVSTNNNVGNASIEGVKK